MGILQGKVIVQVNTGVVDEDVDRTVNIACKALDAGLVGQIERMVLDLLLVLSLQPKAVTRARSDMKRELLGSDVGVGKDRIAYSSADAAVLALDGSCCDSRHQSQ